MQTFSVTADVQYNVCLMHSCNAAYRVEQEVSLLLCRSDMNKVVIKILQGSAVTQTVVGELTLYTPVANFL